MSMGGAVVSLRVKIGVPIMSRYKGLLGLSWSSADGPNATGVREGLMADDDDDDDAADERLRDRPRSGTSMAAVPEKSK